MASERQMYIKLWECINDYCIESEQDVDKKGYKLFNLAIRAMDELGLDFFYQVRSVKLPINANLTAYLPDDFLQYSKIGILNSKGEIIPLTYNQQLTTYGDLSNDRIEKTTDATLFDSLSPISSIGVFYNYWNNGAYTNLYGTPSGSPFVGNFKIDKENGVIVLDHSFTYDYLMLEYIAGPEKETDCFVPIQFREAIIAYLSWKDIRSMPNSRRGSVGDKRDRKSDFYNERKNAIARWKPFYIEQGYQSSQEQTRLTVKV